MTTKRRAKKMPFHGSMRIPPIEWRTYATKLAASEAVLAAMETFEAASKALAKAQHVEAIATHAYETTAPLFLVK